MPVLAPIPEKVLRPSSGMSYSLVAENLIVVEKATANFWRWTFTVLGVVVDTDATCLSSDSALAAGCKKAQQLGRREFGVRIVS